MDALLPRLRSLDRQTSQRSLFVTCGYSTALLMAFALYWFFPFPLSRTGSVVLMVALPYMMGRYRETKRVTDMMGSTSVTASLRCELMKLDAQIRLLPSAIYYLPFVVGANLFWMGLPGPGTKEQKAFLDCGFLAGTVVIFASVYLLNQRIVRRQLIPLRKELASMLAQQPS